jgi:hypothetical protein
LSIQSKHPELAEALVAMIGLSAGGEFCYQFTNAYPNRVLTYATVKGGFYEGQTNSQSRKVPALFISGQLDKAFRREQIFNTFSVNRRLGAPWCYAEENGAAHGVGRSIQLILPFMAGVLSQRSNKKGGPLLGVQEPLEGEIRDPLLQARSPKNGFFQNSAQGLTVWLPNLSIAAIWKRFLTGTLKDDAFLPVIKSSAVNPPIMVMPPSLEVGNILAGKVDSPITFTARALKTPIDWDNLKITMEPNYLKTTIVRTSVSSWKGTVIVLTNSQPLGSFRSDLRIRLVREGKTLLYGLDLPISGVFTGSIQAQPWNLVLGGIPAHTKKSFELVFTNKLNSPFKYNSYSIEGVRSNVVKVTIARKKGQVIVLKCTFLGQKPFEPLSGSILFHFKNIIDNSLRVHFFGISLPYASP